MADDEEGKPAKKHMDDEEEGKPATKPLTADDEDGKPAKNHTRLMMRKENLQNDTHG